MTPAPNLLPHITPRAQETLTYAALLRLPRSTTRAEKLARVDKVMDALGLSKSKETIIGE